MRLGDLDALKKEIGDLYGLPFEEMVEDFTWLKAIDNAPTVKPEITNEDIQNAIKQGYNDGFEMAKAKFERPQGEWKNHNSYYKRCSNCQKIVGFDYILQDGEVFNFCPNCGADMRGGAE